MNKNKCKIAIIFLSISLNMCFGCSKEPSHRDGSFEDPQHMFWFGNKKSNFSYALLSGGLIQADLSVCWAHVPFCLFCYTLSYLSLIMDILAMWECVVETWSQRKTQELTSRQDHV